MPRSKYEIVGVTLDPLDFRAEEGYAGTVLIDTVGGSFKGRITLDGQDKDKFAVAGNIVSSAPLPRGSYSFTIVARDKGQVYYSAQVVTARSPEIPPDVEPEPPEPSAENTMTLFNASGSTVLNYPLQFARAFVEGEIGTYAQIVIDGVPLETQCDVKNRWPDGSLKFAIMAAVVPSLLSGVAATVQFVAMASGNNSVSNAIPAGYDAEIVLTNPAGGTPVYASARDMINAGHYALWASGPIAQTYVVYDRSAARVHDIGFSGYRAFHPWFIVTVWPGLSKVWTRYVGEIMNTEAMQAQTYDLDLTVGGAGMYSQDGIAHRPATRWTRTAWYGGAPEWRINIYHNPAYLAQTKLVPKYDTAVVIPESRITADYSAWLSKPRTIGGTGLWQPYMPTTGGRRDIGLNPSWNVAALLSGDWRNREIMLGQAELAGWWQYQIREGDPTKANMGRTIHCHTRGTYWFLDGRTTPSAVDAVTIIDNGADNGWLRDDAHHPDPHSIPYLLTGDPYWLDGLEMWHGANSLCTNPGYRNYAHMTVYGNGQVRAAAWIYRTMFNAAALLPDSDPLRAVFAQMVDEAVAKDEGQRHINTTEFAGTPQHVFGARAIGTTGDGWSGYGPPPCRWWAQTGAYATTDPALYDTNVAFSAHAHWMTMFVIAALGRGRQLGFPTDALVAWVASHVIGQFNTPGYPPQLTSQYVVPDRKRVGNEVDGFTGAWFESWSETLTGWSAQKQTGLLNGKIEMLYWSLGETYHTKARTALSFVTDQPGGESAWTNCENLMAAKEAESGLATAWADDPTWAVVP